MVTLPEQFEAGGAVHAKNTALVASRILAPVVDVRVRAGARVAAGETLVVLDARELQAQAARAAAALAAAREAVRAIDADQRAADAALRLATASFDRVNRLYTKGVAAGSEFDEAGAALDTARARSSALTARAAETAAALTAAEEASKAAAIAASYAVITSPFGGTVTERLIDPGAMAAPGAPLIKVEDTSLYRLEVSIDEARAHAVNAGETVQTNIGGVSSAWTDGRISEIAGVDASGHSFVVKIDLAATPGMKSGLFGRARLRAGAGRALAAPASAVFRRGQMTFVFVVDRAGVANLRPVTAGVSAGLQTEILSGLNDGERVVDHPPPTLTDGARVADGAGP
jgi:RND family efflux transporter MFP subunit